MEPRAKHKQNKPAKKKFHSAVSTNATASFPKVSDTKVDNDHRWLPPYSNPTGRSTATSDGAILREQSKVYSRWPNLAERFASLSTESPDIVNSSNTSRPRDKDYMHLQTAQEDHLKKADEIAQLSHLAGSQLIEARESNLTSVYHTWVKTGSDLPKSRASDGESGLLNLQESRWSGVATMPNYGYRSEKLRLAERTNLLEDEIEIQASPPGHEIDEEYLGSTGSASRGFDLEFGPSSPFYHPDAIRPPPIQSKIRNHSHITTSHSPKRSRRKAAIPPSQRKGRLAQPAKPKFRQAVHEDANVSWKKHVMSMRFSPQKLVYLKNNTISQDGTVDGRQQEKSLLKTAMGGSGWKNRSVQQAATAKEHKLRLDEELQKMLGGSPTPSITSSQSSSVSSESVHPLLVQYFDFRGDRDIRRERIQELEYMHQEGRIERDFLGDRGEEPDISDEEFEAQYKAKRARMEEDLKEAEEKMAHAAAECSRNGIDPELYIKSARFRRSPSPGSDIVVTPKF